VGRIAIFDKQADAHNLHRITLARKSQASYFGAMKRFVVLMVGIATLAGMPGLVRAQDNAALIAAREEAEERYKRLNSAVEEMQTAQINLQKKIGTLAEEYNRLREDTAKAAAGNASQEDLRKLAKKMVELDEKREADKKLILDKLDALATAIKNAPPPPTVRPSGNGGGTERRPPAHPPANLPDKGYEYEVKSGDSVSKIVKAYRDAGIKVTSQMVQDANPGLNPNALKVGQKIFIPQPPN
jgi:TolA-binding protein